MPVKAPLTVILFAALGAATGTASASEKAECRTFDLFSSGERRMQQAIDLDESGGLSVGDKDIGYREITDAQGKRIGDRYFVGLIEEVDAQGKEKRRTVDVVVRLVSGTLYLEKSKAVKKGRDARILGGTGEFEGAKGYEIVSKDGQANVYHYRIHCDENF